MHKHYLSSSSSLFSALSTGDLAPVTALAESTKSFVVFALIAHTKTVIESIANAKATSRHTNTIVVSNIVY
jgi:hypothetical protein